MKNYPKERLNLDQELNRIYDYVIRVFEKQNRVLKFDEIYGDGSIWKPFNKQGAKEFYNTILESWQEHKTDNCSICGGKGYIENYEDKFPCGGCNLDLNEFLV